MLTVSRQKFLQKTVRKTFLKLTLTIYTLSILFLLTNISSAASISLIRDSETEDFLWNITRPLLKAAGLNEKDIRIYIVNDESLNAFVMGGQNIFINTGLIIKYDDPNVLEGVIAHEIGHIAGGHLARGNEAMKDVSKIAILSYIAGIAAAIAADGDAGYAILAGSNHVAQRLAVKFTRNQEESADKLALQYLKETNKSPEGLMRLLKLFNVQESEYLEYVDEYALTHPISRKRIDYIRSNIKKFNNVERQDKVVSRQMQFVIAKLKGFLEDSDKSLKYYDGNSDYDKYARSIAYFRKGDLGKSLKEIDYLIKKQPNNGYFHELKGQILFESGKVKESIKSYQKSAKYLPNSDLTRISLSASIIALNIRDKELLEFAIKNLNKAKIGEPNNGQVFRELAKAYEKINQKGKSYLALAELNLLKQNDKKAKKYAKLAKKYLNEDKDRSDFIKAEDILAILDSDKSNK